MNITTNIERLDLLKMQFYLLPRMKVSLIWFSLILIFIGIDSAGAMEKIGFFPWLIIFLIVGFLFIIGFTFLCSLMLILMASANKGIIGKQKIALSNTHFIEETEDSETRTKWSGIQKVLTNKNFIYVLITGYRVHIIPRRAFEDKGCFEEFEKEIMYKYKNA